MTELQYIDELLRLKRKEREISAATFARIEEALFAYPLSTRLWCIRGDCIQLGAEDSPHALGDALASYEKALEIDPACAEAHESVGYYFDVVDEDLAKAEAGFAAAVQFGNRPHSYYGLARVMAERGRSRDDVLALIAKCPDQESPVIREIREESLRGEWEPKKEEPNQPLQRNASTGSVSNLESPARRG